MHNLLQALETNQRKKPNLKIHLNKPYRVTTTFNLTQENPNEPLEGVLTQPLTQLTKDTLFVIDEAPEAFQTQLKSIIKLGYAKLHTPINTTPTISTQPPKTIDLKEELIVQKILRNNLEDKHVVIPTTKDGKISPLSKTSTDPRKTKKKKSKKKLTKEFLNAIKSKPIKS